MKNSWWKILAVILVIYTIVGGFLFDVPRKPILNESIRNLYFHVPMWFGMMTMFFISLFFSIRYLRSNNELDDVKSIEFVNAGILFGILGMTTGMVWAQFTWGKWWSGDPKQNASAILLLIYFAYIILRGSMTDSQQRAKVSAVYNIFAAASIIPLLFILPRMTDSLHPGNGGNPGFNAYDLDSKMRMIFYPAIIGWILLGIWLAELRIRIKKIENALLEN
ncbi:MAG: cytochrome c biogenesis protein CcsA [Bacteroidia bacterium]